MTNENKIISIYQNLLDAWNTQNARGMADLFAEDGEQIGFDGSQSIGSAEIFAHLEPIFKHHRTARFVSKVKSVKLLSDKIAILRAIAGMVPPGQSDINPSVNTLHTLVVQENEGNWKIKLFQNTPA
ncbi:SgcJ/EcaC family oxidoreductase [Bacillus sp. JJ1562]|uniref:SgcJ/EcaC family oxidoreductase n=1 Tax=Bacillus sp. JJ1562 TaxID=3122960 RepID=UPI003002313D